MNSINIYENVEYIDIFNKIDVPISKILIDTRKIKDKDCYIGIRGEKNNGNLMYMDAFLKGASIAILENVSITDDIMNYLVSNNKCIILVKSTIHALGSLAKYKRSLFKSPVIAVTGSAGKTSTKDMIYSVLKEKYKVHKTIGNQNNHIGLPLTILSLNPETEILVLEMGMNHLGEISYLTDIAKPDIAVITNVGTAHIGNLGSRENILKAKLEILEGLSKDGTLIINNDNDLLHNWYLENNNKFNIKTIGIKNKSDYTAQNIEELEDSSKFICNGCSFRLPTPGEHFIYNSLVAIAVANIFNLSCNKIKKGILNFELSSNRMNIINLDNEITIIDDSYNANFDSMSYAIKYLSSLDGKNIAVLGDMLELGKFSKNLHKKIGALIACEDIDILITVGNDAININNGAINNGFNEQNSYNFTNNIDAINLLNELIDSNTNILIKASNSMNFKEIVNNIGVNK